VFSKLIDRFLGGVELGEGGDLDYRLIGRPPTGMSSLRPRIPHRRGESARRRMIASFDVAEKALAHRQQGSHSAGGGWSRT
jgi:hypothetical protein